VIGGDSAGGNLTLVTLLALREAGDPLPAGGLFISGCIDLEGTGATMSSEGDITREFLHAVAETYLEGADPRQPLVSPLYADLRGLPPLFLQVGGAETLLDDAVRLADLAERDGVAATLDVWEDMTHSWHLFAFMVPEGQQAIERMGGWVRQHVP
jgi:acetyl esterase/lipase